MVVIYVPLKKQRSYVEDLVKDGWENLDKVKLKDHFGTEIEVMVLKKDIQ